MKNSYLPLLLITLSIGLYFLYISPELTQIKGLSAKKAEYDSVLLKASVLSSKRDAILAEYNSIPREDIERLGKIITDEYDSELFANDIYNIASKHDIELGTMRDNAANSSGIELDDGSQIPFKTNIVTINVSGKYDSFVRFLSDIESSLRLMDVKSLKIVSVESDERRTEGYEFTLEIIVYSLK